MNISMDLLKALSIKRRVFVSYHHGADQSYYDNFSVLFSDIYDLVKDNSLDRIIDSYDTDYVMRRIRENYISGTSCTIILCGQETFKRKYVDWEIKASLDKGHAVIGVSLPNIFIDFKGARVIPDRLHDNLISGYIEMIDWNELVTNPHLLKASIEKVNIKSKWLINNSRELKKING